MSVLDAPDANIARFPARPRPADQVLREIREVVFPRVDAWKRRRARAAFVKAVGSAVLWWTIRRLADGVILLAPLVRLARRLRRRAR